MRYLVVVAVLLAASPARAEKSETTAKVLAGGGTVVAGSLILSSFLIHPQEENVYEPTLYTGIGLAVVAPSLGHFYVGKYFTVGMALRGAAGALALYGASRKQEQSCENSPPGMPMTCESISASGLTLISLAAILAIGGVAYDVRDAPNAVEHYNKYHASLVPTAMPHGGGLALTGSF